MLTGPIIHTIWLEMASLSCNLTLYLGLCTQQWPRTPPAVRCTPEASVVKVTTYPRVPRCIPDIFEVGEKKTQPKTHQRFRALSWILFKCISPVVSLSPLLTVKPIHPSAQMLNLSPSLLQRTRKKKNIQSESAYVWILSIYYNIWCHFKNRAKTILFLHDWSCKHRPNKY